MKLKWDTIKTLGNILIYRQVEEVSKMAQDEEVTKETTAKDEIEKARRSLARAIRGALEEGVGDSRLTKIGMLAAALENITVWGD